ncbi:hypothetical protein [Eubacterium sp.]|uniref:hypothetical protein n=1 Tax=Eubacterium sp. TaxID=142586 RepID=UPI00258E6200|nr:hypothetical protein [Eubacterium sp.]MCR5368381.1 hypothetical protein [Eubacterium sp.]
MFIAHINNNGLEQSCKEHMVGVAEKTANKLKKIGLYKTGYLTGVLHDAGKFSDEFNEYIKLAFNKQRLTDGNL